MFLSRINFPACRRRCQGFNKNSYNDRNHSWKVTKLVSHSTHRWQWGKPEDKPWQKAQKHIRLYKKTHHLRPVATVYLIDYSRRMKECTDWINYSQAADLWSPRVASSQGHEHMSKYLSLFVCKGKMTRAGFFWTGMYCYLVVEFEIFLSFLYKLWSPISELSTFPKVW